MPRTGSEPFCPTADHGNGTGTNIRAALMEVYNMILFQKESFVQQHKPDAWKKIRHAIIVLTDGEEQVLCSLGDRERFI